MNDRSKFEQGFEDITTPKMIYEFQIDKFKIGRAYVICMSYKDSYENDRDHELLHGILLRKSSDKLTFVVAGTIESENFIKSYVSGRFSAPIGDDHYTFDIYHRKILRNMHFISNR